MKAVRCLDGVSSSTGKTCIGKLSEFIGIYCDRFKSILGANSSQFTVFAAIHTKSKIFIGLELLTVTKYHKIVQQ